jgi:hypothetical protein
VLPRIGFRPGLREGRDDRADRKIAGTAGDQRGRPFDVRGSFRSAAEDAGEVGQLFVEGGALSWAAAGVRRIVMVKLANQPLGPDPA